MPHTRPGDTPAVDAPVGPRTWWPVAAVLLAIAWGGNEFTPLLVMYREQGHLGDVTVDALLAAYVFGIRPLRCCWVGRCPTGTAAVRCCCPPRPWVPWARSCWPSTRRAPCCSRPAACCAASRSGW